MHARTTAAVAGTAQPIRSPRRTPDQRMPRKGWARLSWPIRLVPPAASPWYHATEPANMLIVPA